MSNGKNPESRDEMLASLRRIARSDDNPEDPAREAAGDGEAALLLLTPEMRSDGGAPAANAAGRLPEAQALRAMVREILAEELADGEAEAEVRAIIRDELQHGEAGGDISRKVLRQVRAESAKGQGEG